MADKLLTSSEFDSVYRKWISRNAEMVNSERNNPYPSFGVKDSELAAAFAVLIKSLRLDHGYTEEDMDMAKKQVMDKICPKLATHTSRETEGWKSARGQKWEAAMIEVFGSEASPLDKYNKEDFKKELKTVAPTPKTSTQDEEPLPNKPDIDDNDKFEESGEVEIYNPLDELGLDDE